jgi:hypothetical protein
VAEEVARAGLAELGHPPRSGVPGS